MNSNAEINAARAEGAEDERRRIVAAFASPAAKRDPAAAMALILGDRAVNAGNLAERLAAVAEARRIAADASWGSVVEKLNAERRPRR